LARVQIPKDHLVMSTGLRNEGVLHRLVGDPVEHVPSVLVPDAWCRQRLAVGREDECGETVEEIQLALVFESLLHLPRRHVPQLDLAHDPLKYALIRLRLRAGGGERLAVGREGGPAAEVMALLDLAD